MAKKKKYISVAPPAHLKGKTIHHGKGEPVHLPKAPKSLLQKIVAGIRDGTVTEIGVPED
jgi:hypothetical protein